MKYTLIAFAILTSTLVNAQSWFDIGIKGAYNPGVIMNPNVFDDGAYTWEFQGGFFAGAKLGFNFNDEHAITADFLYNQLNQRVNILDLGNVDFTQTSVQIPILYRHGSENGGYGEIGPQININMGASRSTPFSNEDMTDKLVGTSYSLVAGFGQYIAAGYLVGATFGFRFAYDFTDMVAPEHRGSPGVMYTPIQKDLASYTYAPSNPFYAGVVIEFNLDFGHMASAQCGKSTKFMLFK